MNPPNGGKVRPWEAAGMRRSSWYRHGKPDKKPERETAKTRAEECGVSLRTYQRHDATYWPDFWSRRDAAMREAGFNGPWDRESIKSWLDRHPEKTKAIHDASFDAFDAKI